MKLWRYGLIGLMRFVYYIRKYKDKCFVDLPVVHGKLLNMFASSSFCIFFLRCFLRFSLS